MAAHGASAQMQPGVTQLGEGPGALGQHGCAEETGAGIEVQTPFGVNRRRAAIRMARPKYLLAVMDWLHRSAEHDRARFGLMLSLRNSFGVNERTARRVFFAPIGAASARFRAT